MFQERSFQYPDDDGLDEASRRSQPARNSRSPQQSSRRTLRQARPPKAFNGIHRRRGKKLTW